MEKKSFNKNLKKSPVKKTAQIRERKEPGEYQSKKYPSFKKSRPNREDYVKKLIRNDEADNTNYSPRKTDNEMRLNKYIANSGICSRREADKYIAAGVVEVNGVVITELGSRVKPGDKVKFNGESIKSEAKVYILLNKPKDVVTTLDDPHADRTVIDLVKGACTERVYPIGRLDRNTTGVLLLTNDGDLTKKLTHPKFERKKIYHVFLHKPVTQAHLEQLVNGIELEDGRAWADVASYVDNDKSQVGIEIHSGKNRIIRRLFESLGYKVKKLDRVFFAGLTKKNLPRGKWRFLTDKEVSQLKMGAYE